MNIVFMGTPEFAAVILASLLTSKHHILAVLTQPDKPVGRKLILTPSPVKMLAQQHKIPVFCPSTLKSEETLNQLKTLQPDVIVVAAYGVLLPKQILELPKFGCINVHASLLPKYRGAAPIQWSLINGEPETGITIMFMEEKLDAGAIVNQKSIKIADNDSAKTLFAKLATLGASALLEGLELLTKPDFKAKPQNHAQATFAPKITKEMGYLDFSKPAQEVFNLIRGLDIWPVARAQIGGKTVKILKAKIVPNNGLKPGEIAKTKQLIIGCADSAIELLTVAPENGKLMSGSAFVNGYLT
ncbi:MAG: methionyl-tRNA formyltransferase [Oscillospiraceae bacterium]|nr:methionyl-tRNA formyltransferase [Oscillospiraceae bacterium]